MNRDLFKLRPASFGLALFCFLLPFITLSCPGGSYTISGVGAAFGTTIEGERVGGDFLAVLAFFVALIALALAFVKDRRDVLTIDIVFGIVGVGLLLLLSAKTSSEAAKQGHGLVRVSMAFGYWLCLVSLAVGSVLGFLEWSEGRAAATGATSGTPEPVLPEDSRAKRTDSAAP